MAGFREVQAYFERKGLLGQVQILGVTKKQPLQRIEKEIEAGLLHLGNNYVQEGEQLRLQLKHHTSLQWHFIGQIQSRKLKTIATYDWVHSLDKIDHARKLNAHLKDLNKKIKVFIQVNLGQEQTKGGVVEHELDDFLAQLQPLDQLETKGLMILPPPLEDTEQRRPFFKKAVALGGKYQSLWSGSPLYSMGTSDDYLIAAEEGASFVRLGTTLFGPRDLNL